MSSRLKHINTPPGCRKMELLRWVGTAWCVFGVCCIVREVKILLLGAKILMLDEAILCNHALCSINTRHHGISNILYSKCGAAATDQQLLLTQRYVALAAPTSWIIGHQEIYRLSPVALFTGLSTPTPRCHLLLFPIINSVFVVSTDYSLSRPMDPSFSLPVTCQTQS